MRVSAGERTARATAPRGRVYMWDDRVLYVGPDLPSTRHAHHAVQVCVSLSEPLRFRSSRRGRWRRCDGAVIPSDVPHQTDPVVSFLATFWVDAEATDAKRLVASCGGDTIRSIEQPQQRELITLLRASSVRTLDSSGAARLLDEAIRILAPREDPSLRPPLDGRVARALEMLRSAPMRRVSPADLAAAVSLSPSRITHLLRPHLGLPVRRYLLWLRLRDALRELSRGGTITDAAHAAGFADAPHLDRTFRRMLGFTPSAVLHVSQFVQDGLSSRT